MTGNGRAALNIQGTNETYFFHNQKYCKIQWHPGKTEGEKVTEGPNSIDKEWQALRKAGFKQVDAALEIGNNMAYIFCGRKYCRVRGKDEMIGNVQNISSGWPSLKEAKFETVDAALRTPGHPNQAYFFSGNKYVRVEFQVGQTNDRIVDGPKSIHEGWPNLAFREIDMALPRPDNDQQGVYLFSEDKYMQVKVDVGGPNDEVISDEREVAKYWPALKEAGFYH
ncbi:hemopexin domain protein [Ceratobasidium sp. AG-Ba]|nr:hemopexin domain protein [Ceratobasidium sp. AG-Ba]